MNKDFKSARPHQHKAIIASLLLAFAGLFTITGVYFSDTPFYGYSGSIFSNPHFGPNGREPIFYTQQRWLGIPVYLLVGINVGIFGMLPSEMMNLVTMIGISLGLAMTARRFSMPSALKSLLISGLIGYTASFLTAIITGQFPLYFPSRYTTILLVVILWIGYLSTTKSSTSLRWRLEWIGMMTLPFMLIGNIGDITRMLMVAILIAPGMIPRRILSRSWTIPITLIAAMVIPHLSRIERTPGAVVPENWEIQLIERLHNQPKSTMIAGLPDMMNNIPIHARRSVYLSFELDTEMRADWARERFMRLFDAYFAEEFPDVLAFGEAEGVHLILVDRRLFEPAFLEKCAAGESRIYLEPHNTQILNLIRERKTFALRSPPIDRVIFQYGPLILVSLRKENG